MHQQKCLTILRQNTWIMTETIVLKTKIKKMSLAPNICKQFVKRVSLFTKTVPMTWYIRSCDKEAAASNSLPSSELDFMGRKRKANKKNQFQYIYQLSKATRSFLCTLEQYRLDYFFSNKHLIPGGEVNTTCHSRKYTLEENEEAPKQASNLTAFSCTTNNKGSC